MGSKTRRIYINKPANTGGNILRDNSKVRYINEQDLGDSIQYDSLDYDQLNKSDREKDKHIYRGLDFNSEKETGRQANPPKNENSIRLPKSQKADSQNKDYGQRTFRVIIVLLAIVLTAVAVTFGILYFKAKDGSSASSPQTDVSDKPTTEGTTTKLPASQSSSSLAAVSSTLFTTVTTSVADLTTTEPLSIEEKCQAYGGMIADPVNCHVYHNCSKEDGYVMTCDFPKLFNTETSQCELFEGVMCGERKEYKNDCDYRWPYPPCYPCQPGYFNCEGKQDGFNVMDTDPWRPYYILCYKERYVAHFSCPPDTDLGIQYFSPEYTTCVSLFRIPQSRGGRMPNCKGKEDGRNPDELGGCDHYHECAWGQYVRSTKCPTGQAYDEVLKACMNSPANMCKCAGIGC